jgi:hypothetical protein
MSDYILPTKDDILDEFYKSSLSINTLTEKLAGSYMSFHHDNRDWDKWCLKVLLFKKEIKNIIDILLEEQIIEKYQSEKNTDTNEIDEDKISYRLTESFKNSQIPEFKLNTTYVNCKTHIEYNGNVAIITNSCYGGFGYSELTYTTISKWKKEFPDISINYRTSPFYIAAVELLGKKSRGNYSNPCIEWIPFKYFENDAYEITEYDGSESVQLYPERIISNLLYNFTLTEDLSRKDLYDFIHKLKNDDEKSNNLYFDCIRIININNPFNDFTIKTIDNNDLKYSKVILYSKSGYFRKLLTEQKDLMSIDLPFTSDVVKFTINSLYLNILDFNGEKSSKILKAIELILYLDIDMWIEKIEKNYHHIDLNKNIVDEYKRIGLLFNDKYY